MHPLRLLEIYRDRGWERRLGAVGNDVGGCFTIPSKIDGQELRVLASSGAGWDHVSVSRSSRCPNWLEMEQVKRLFFRPDEMAMQLHVPVDDHIDCHSYCLHIWRPHDVEIPRPPAWMVGPEAKAG